MGAGQEKTKEGFVSAIACLTAVDITIHRILLGQCNACIVGRS